MSDLRPGPEFDAKVLRAMGYDVRDIKGHVLYFSGQWWSVDLAKFSTSDAEAVRICLPWLRAKCPHVVIAIYEDGVSVTVDKMLGLLRYAGDGDTLAHALCLAVLVVAEKEQADAT